MKYKVRNDSYEDMSVDLLNTLLSSRGVKNINHFLNVNEKDEIRYNRIANIRKASKLYIAAIEAEARVVMIVDADYDGQSTSAMLRNYTNKNMSYDLEYVIHKKKSHGIKIDELESPETIDLLVIPDAGTSDIEEMDELLEMNPHMRFIILDHHKPELMKIDEDEEGKPIYESIEDFLDRNPGIVVNPEVCDYEHSSLCGAAVVYKFLQCLDSYLGIKDADNYLDLVATALVADSMDLKAYEARYLTLKGITMLEEDRKLRAEGKAIRGNEFLHTIIDSKAENKLKHITITSIGWEIAPVINATVRMGKEEQKIDMFKAFCGETEDGRTYQPRRPNGSPKDSPKPDRVPITLQEAALRGCTSAKSKQDRDTKKYYEKLKERIEEKKLNENQVLMVDSTDTIPESSLSGLVANKLTDDYRKPVICLRKFTGSLYGGSIRNYDKSPIDSFRELINNSGLATASGHDNAAGWRCEKRNLVKIRDWFNKELENIVFEDVYHVDYEIPVGRLKSKDVLQVGRMHNIWGNGVEKPLFAITNVTLNVSDIDLIGSKKNTIKFKKGNHDFIKFFSGQEELDKMRMRNKKGFGKNPSRVTFDLICEMQINEWNNGYEIREFPQLVIIDYNVRKADEITF